MNIKMKKTLNLISILFFLSCNQPDSNRISTNSENNSFQKDSLMNVPVNVKIDSVSNKSEEITVALIKRKPDTTFLLKISSEILKTIKKRDYYKLASYVHPDYRILFSPYGYIDTIDSKVFSPTQLKQLAKNNKRINWNSSWDAEDTELLTIDQYFKKYVYDVDFLNAPVKSINEFRSRGTDLNNIKEVYPECDVVEFYFPGFEEKFGGLDFRGLRMVFKLHDKKFYIVAIVHDEWTP